MTNLFRLESKNRLFVISNQGNGEYKVVGGPLKGKIVAEMHKLITVPKGRTAEQHVDVLIAKLVNSKVKHGFTLKKGDINELNASVEMITKGASRKARLEKQLKRMEPIFKKAEVVFKKREAKLAAIREELAKYATPEATDEKK